jgi:ubiquinone/menaquinone biosynthesis C-methylase UbiE
MPDAVVTLYEAHPVSAEQILGELRARGKQLDSLSPEDLFPLDQDHYGGTDATEALAQRAGIHAGDVVLDLCSGLGGPARLVAMRFGCSVTGIDLTPMRVDDATRLTELVGLSGRVEFLHGDVTDLPFQDASFDACLSQESFLHVADKAGLFRECQRVLRRGGRIAFSDWALQPSMSAGERARLEGAFSAPGITSAEAYADHLRHAGFEAVEVDDLSEQWRPLLLARLELVRSHRDRTIARFGEEHFLRWEAEYAFMVGLAQAGKLGGARYIATAP